MVWKTIKTLGGGLYAEILGLSVVLFSALLRIDLLYQPNSFDVFSWSAFLYVFIQYIKTKENRYLYFAALIFGFGFLNKYNIGFLLVGLIPALLVSKERVIFSKKEFYYALGLGLILILPNLLWQLKNDFPVVHHMKELASRQLVNVKRTDFLKEQVMFYMGGLPVLVAALIGLIKSEHLRKYRLLALSFIVTLSVFTFLKAKAYYAIGIYPIYLGIGAVYLERILKSSWVRYLKPVLVALPILVFSQMFRVVFPNKSPEYIKAHSKTYSKLGLLRWEDGKDHELPQDFADMLGWKELSAKVDSLYKTFPEANKPFVMCDNYGQAGSINFYSSIPALKANSFNADYIDWIDSTQTVRNIILVEDATEDRNDHSKEEALFEKVILVDSIANPYAREYGTRIYLLLNNKKEIMPIITAEIKRRKAEY